MKLQSLIPASLIPASLIRVYQKSTPFGKLLFFASLWLIAVVVLKPFVRTQENMSGITEEFSMKEGYEVYDDFYADLYDYLVFSNVKNKYEIGKIISITQPNEQSMIADIGCGSGHHVSELASKNYPVVGIDISPAMVRQAKKNYPSCEFVVGNALEDTLFERSALTHILCLYFTVYYFPDKRQFFRNCMDWLMPGGYLVLHLVDRETFDPILPPGNPLYVVSPQKYSKQRITNTKVTFQDFVYTSNFSLDTNADLGFFDEKFKFKDGKVRKQQQKLYMEDTSDIINMALECGFLLQEKNDMVSCAYENQFLYVLVKP
jgi:SAM-dependent methyltransferase